MLLTPETASFCESGFAPCRCAQDGRAPFARYCALSVREDGRNSVTSWTLDIHKIAIRVLDQPLLFVGPLLVLWARVQ